jgi:hypothetical protein
MNKEVIESVVHGLLANHYKHNNGLKPLYEGYGSTPSAYGSIGIRYSSREDEAK